jgi:hypothetical protein
MPKEDWVKNPVHEILKRNNLWPFGPINSVLDVACGLSLKSKFLEPKIIVGVDIYSQYFQKIECSIPYTVIKYDVRHLLDIFQPRSFEVVYALDIIEHLEKHESLSLIEQCKIIATKAVVVETPLGYIPQNLDILGYGGHEYQTHRCGWEVEELQSLDFSCITRSYTMSNVKRHTEIEVDPQITFIDAIHFIKSSS